MSSDSVMWIIKLFSAVLPHVAFRDFLAVGDRPILWRSGDQAIRSARALGNPLGSKAFFKNHPCEATARLLGRINGESK
jgi:hypothetical protein